VPARIRRSAVGPEPRSKAEPIALGAVAGVPDFMAGSLPEARLVSSALFGPETCASTRAVLVVGAVVTGVVDVGLGFVPPELVWFVGFEPPPLCTHST
jgi:hypothetical protein